MSDSERAERLARLEARTEEQERRLQNIEHKLARLLEMASLGKGSLWMMLKFAAFLAAIGAAFAWTWEKIN